MSDFETSCHYYFTGPESSLEKDLTKDIEYHVFQGKYHIFLGKFIKYGVFILGSDIITDGKAKFEFGNLGFQHFPFIFKAEK